MHADLIISAIVGMLAIVMTLIGLTSAGRANRTQARAAIARAEIDKQGADAQAYVTARGMYEGLLISLRDEVARVRASNAELEQKVARNQAEHEEQILALSGELEEVRAENRQLRAEIAAIRNGGF
jgi:hypothetical protein